MDKKTEKTDSAKMFDKYIFSVPYSDHLNFASGDNLSMISNQNGMMKARPRRK